MAANLQLDFTQIKNLVDQLDFEDKERLARYLDDQTLFLKLAEFRKRMRDIPLTLDEITAEVEAVREERYREGRH
jgi:hypothetical protein